MEQTSTPSRVEGKLAAPASKSYAQRAVAASLLSRGQTLLTGLTPCEDTLAALDAAFALGAEVERVAQGILITGGLQPREATIDIGESGLAARLFTPIAALCAVPITITGRGSVMKRPMNMMLGTLERMGVRVLDNSGGLPLEVCGPITGGTSDVDGSGSSQFVSGLLMALPMARQNSILRVTNPVSTPYIEMTLAVMRAFGVTRLARDNQEFRIVAGQQYNCPQYAVEGDWSGASCLLVAGATAGSITIDNLNPDSLQADTAILEALRLAGANVTVDRHTVSVSRGRLKAFRFDATHCPDLFPALAALAANCKGTSQIIGTNRLAHKESDRATALRDEFSKMGITIDISQSDIMKITGGKAHGAVVDSHGDHRIAMSAAVAALTASSQVTIHGAEAVSKSYPHFWQDLLSLTR